MRQVAPEILDVLEPDGEPQEPVADAELGLHLPVDESMCQPRRMWIKESVAPRLTAGVISSSEPSTWAAAS